MTDYSFEHSQALRLKYPQYIPIILVGDINLSKTKLLIKKEMSVSQLMSYIRTYNKLNKREAYFLFTENNILLTQSSALSEIYTNFVSDNGFLFITVKKENTFG